ncbi:MAG: hypothetical protein ACRDQ4_02665 [Pseudonocardiaceae bacterium]
MIGGKVLDASALAALVRGQVSAAAWFATARTMSLPLYLPTLALAEVRAVRPDAGAQLAEVVGHADCRPGPVAPTGTAPLRAALHRPQSLSPVPADA